MDFVELILTVCALSQPANCDERKIMLESATGSPLGCMMQAMPYIAQWSGEHPAVQVSRWRCVRPGSEGEKI
jgi:hypothetical protein